MDRIYILLEIIKTFTIIILKVYNNVYPRKNNLKWIQINLNKSFNLITIRYRKIKTSTNQNKVQTRKKKMIAIINISKKYPKNQLNEMEKNHKIKIKYNLIKKN
jgi:hypothetical protein